MKIDKELKEKEAIIIMKCLMYVYKERGGRLVCWWMGRRVDNNLNYLLFVFMLSE